ncbi:MAG: hypothetical protein U0350_47220 [Caldilineaceae bacterium]
MPNYPIDQTNAAENLQLELAAVQQQLINGINELYPPLRDLVRSEFKLALPPQRAAIVLTAGVGDPDSDDLREKRILLAAALEMLYIALHIHHALLTNTPVNGDKGVDKSLLGSIILAGDYCFSRAAMLAARTNNPEVVMLFSNALKAVSEGKLRQYFSKTSSSFDENQKLLEAGARAAAVLAHLPEPTREALVALVAALAETGISNDSAMQQSAEQLPHTLTSLQKTRWTAFLKWFFASQNAA